MEYDEEYKKANREIKQEKITDSDEEKWEKYDVKKIEVKIEQNIEYCGGTYSEDYVQVNRDIKKEKKEYYEERNEECKKEINYILIKKEEGTLNRESKLKAILENPKLIKFEKKITDLSDSGPADDLIFGNEPNCKASDILFSKRVALKHSTKITENTQITNSVHLSQVNNVSTKVCLPQTEEAKKQNAIVQIENAHPKVTIFNSAENQIQKQNVANDKLGTIDPTSFLTSKEENKSNIHNTEQFNNDTSYHKYIIKEDLNNHVCKHTKEKPYTCDLCDDKCSTKANIKRHIQFKHSKEKKYSCHICQYKCVRRDQLNIHLRKHTKEKPYKCTLCDYTCSVKHHLKRHMQYKHTNEKNFSCHLCPYKCVTKRELSHHIHKHTKEKPYMCSLCDYRCSQKGNLKSHMQFKHTKEKNFSCHLCKYKSVTKVELNNHLCKHTNEKPYVCDLCDYRCSLKGNLKVHMQFKHIKEKNFACHMCQYKCVTKSNLSKHVLKHTLESPST